MSQNSHRVRHETPHAGSRNGTSLYRRIATKTGVSPWSTFGFAGYASTDRITGLSARERATIRRAESLLRKRTASAGRTRYGSSRIAGDSGQKSSPPAVRSILSDAKAQLQASSVLLQDDVFDGSLGQDSSHSPAETLDRYRGLGSSFLGTGLEIDGLPPAVDTDRQDADSTASEAEVAAVLALLHHLPDQQQDARRGPSSNSSKISRYNPAATAAAARSVSGPPIVGLVGAAGAPAIRRTTAATEGFGSNRMEGNPAELFRAYRPEEQDQVVAAIHPGTAAGSGARPVPIEHLLQPAGGDSFEGDALARAATGKPFGDQLQSFQDQGPVAEAAGLSRGAPRQRTAAAASGSSSSSGGSATLLGPLLRAWRDAASDGRKQRAFDALARRALMRRVLLSWRGIGAKVRRLRMGFVATRQAVRVLRVRACLRHWVRMRRLRALLRRRRATAAWSAWRAELSRRRSCRRMVLRQAWGRLKSGVRVRAALRNWRRRAMLRRAGAVARRGHRWRQAGHAIRSWRVLLLAKRVRGSKRLRLLRKVFLPLWRAQTAASVFRKRALLRLGFRAISREAIWVHRTMAERRGAEVLLAWRGAVRSAVQLRKALLDRHSLETKRRTKRMVILQLRGRVAAARALSRRKERAWRGWRRAQERLARRRGGQDSLQWLRARMLLAVSHRRTTLLRSSMDSLRRHADLQRAERSCRGLVLRSSGKQAMQRWAMALRMRRISSRFQQAARRQALSIAWQQWLRPVELRRLGGRLAYRVAVRRAVEVLRKWRRAWGVGRLARLLEDARPRQMLRVGLHGLVMHNNRMEMQQQGLGIFRRVALRRMWTAWAVEARPSLRRDRRADAALSRACLLVAVRHWRRRLVATQAEKSRNRAAVAHWALSKLRFVVRRRWLPYVAAASEYRASKAVARAFAHRLLLRRSFRGLITACRTQRQYSRLYSECAKASAAFRAARAVRRWRREVARRRFRSQRGFALLGAAEGVRCTQECGCRRRAWRQWRGALAVVQRRRLSGRQLLTVLRRAWWRLVWSKMREWVRLSHAGETLVLARRRLVLRLGVGVWRESAAASKAVEQTRMDLLRRQTLFARRRALQKWRARSVVSQRLRACAATVAGKAARRIARGYLRSWRARLDGARASRRLGAAASQWWVRRVAVRCMQAWICHVRRMHSLRRLQQELTVQQTVRIKLRCTRQWRGLLRSKGLLRRAWIGWRVAARIARKDVEGRASSHRRKLPQERSAARALTGGNFPLSARTRCVPKHVGDAVRADNEPGYRPGEHRSKQQYQSRLESNQRIARLRRSVEKLEARHRFDASQAMLAGEGTAIGASASDQHGVPSSEPHRQESLHALRKPLASRWGSTISSQVIGDTASKFDGGSAGTSSVSGMRARRKGKARKRGRQQGRPRAGSDHLVGETASRRWRKQSVAAMSEPSSDIGVPMDLFPPRRRTMRRSIGVAPDFRSRDSIVQQAQARLTAGGQRYQLDTAAVYRASRSGKGGGHQTFMQQVCETLLDLEDEGR